MTQTALHRMIRAQADALDRIAGLDLAAPAAILAEARRVILVGTGTSQHAAELGVLMLERAGVDSRWFPAATWVRWSTGPRQGDALVVITHTGQTGYAARARAEALASGVPVVSITGTGPGWPEAITTVAPEESETYTVSYTAALAVLARLAHLVARAGDGSGAGAQVDGSAGDVLQAAAAIRVAYAAAGTEDVPVPARSLGIVGCGPWGVTAREAALKIREGARMLAEGFDAERFLHGNAVPFTAADGVLLLQPEADPDGLTAAVGEAAAREGIPVSLLSLADSGLSPLLAQLPMTVHVQLLAERFARLRGQDPDTVITGAWADPDLWQIGMPAVRR
ncbi:MAG TPA: SIS domain-containing protein [Streptosporangiaceae bacterium]